MKSILIIGLGRFGHQLAIDFIERGNQVMVVDDDENEVNELAPYVTSARIGDCTNPEVLKNLGLRNFDLIFVCIGTNFQSSLEITSLCKELGGKRVISKATRDIQAKFLLRNGADEIIDPDKDIAEKWATRCSMTNVFDYIELTEDYGIYEVPPLKEWIGKSIRTSNIAAKYKVSIMGMKDEEENMHIMPNADYVIRADEHLMILAHDDTIKNIMKKIEKQ